ncbi:MAG: hypothetical protein LIO49_09390 [Ruminococcus sp.]|nr:hypothetical protein [Ruminococcus sp.]
MKRVKTSRRKTGVKEVFADISSTYGGAGGSATPSEGNYKSRWQVNW